MASVDPEAVVCGVLLPPGAQVLASGSVQVPRFTLLQSGGLQIQPVSFQDSGEYTCVASNSEGTVNATSTLTVWSKTHTHTQQYSKRLNRRLLNRLKQTMEHLFIRIDVQSR